MKNSAYKRAKNSWFNKALNEFSRIGEGAVVGGMHAIAGIPFGDPLGYGLSGFRKGYKYEKRRQKAWRRGLKGQITGSAPSPIYGSAPPRKGPVYGSNPHPPIYGSPPLPRDPVKYKLEFLTPIISPVEKWHKGRLC